MEDGLVLVRDDLLVEPLETPLALAHDSRLKRPVAIARRVDRNRAMLGRERFRRRAVARVPHATRRRLAVLVAEMVGQLDLHRPLNKALGQPGEQTTGPDDLLVAARTGEQPVDEFVRQPFAQSRRQTLAGTPKGRRRLAIRRVAGALPNLTSRSENLVLSVIVSMKLPSRAHAKQKIGQPL